MSQPADSNDASLSREDRKRLLVLACATDRAAWCRACEPHPRPPVAMASHVLRMLDPLLALIPGLPGRWLRKASFFAHIGRAIGLIPS